MPTLEFTLMTGCPLKCTFCPQDTLRGIYGKNRKYLPLDAFKTILDKVPKHVRIDFSGMAEPWANPDATSMLRYALESGYAVAIYTTLYGMETADAAAVVELLRRHAAQIEVLCIHLPDRSGNMRGWRYSSDYESNLRAFVGLGLSGVLPRVEVMTMDAGGKAHADLDHLGIQLGAWTGLSRAGNLHEKEVPDQPLDQTPRHEGPVTCGFTPFYDQNVCLPNGDVVLCCMDYSLKHKIGNLLEQDYYQMFASGGLANLIGENMIPRSSSDSLCKSCNRARAYGLGPNKLFWQARQ